MATSTKRAWKLQEFTAHGANVNCLALGKKSGRVLVTGGDDKKVNLWAVGKTGCIMSLSGHTTPVEHVRFGNSEELVCAGSMSGALKIWDLEAAKIVRTLTGHKANIRSLDFHPYAEFLASGSVDTNIKLWDIRRKGCIFTYKGHRHTVNSLKFSPDGRWIASAGEDGVVKLWDLPAGKMLAEFIGHAAPVNDVQFHPNEFLLASGSTDKTVKFWDLESFQLVSTTESDPGAVRSIYFHPGGECLYSGAQDSLRIYGWEPARLHDKIDFKWGKVADISNTRNHLIAASYHQMQVTLSMVDLQRMQPFNASSSPERSTNNSQSPFQSGTPMRKSFIRRNPSSGSKNDPAIPIKTSEENENLVPEVDPGDDALSLADIKNPADYKAIFQPRGRELCRTPPLGIEIFPAIFEDEPTKPEPRRPEVSKPEPRRLETVKQEPKRPDVMKSVPLRLDVNKVDPRRQEVLVQRQASPPVCVDVQRQEPARPDMVRHSPVKVETSKSETYRIEHYSESVTEKLMTVSVNSPPHAPAMLRLEPVETIDPRGVPFIHTPPKNVDNQPQILNMKPGHILNMKMQEYLTDKVEKCDRVDFIPAQRDHSVGLDVDEFLPQSRKRLHDSFHFSGQQKPDISEAEAISSIIKGHDSMVYVLTTRQRNVEIVHTLWANKDLKTAMESAIHMNDSAVIVDILNNIVLKPSIWNLDLCVTLLPSVFELLQSKYETQFVPANVFIHTLSLMAGKEELRIDLANELTERHECACVVLPFQPLMLRYMTAGCGALRIILKNFGPLIRSNISAPPGIGIDLSREERYSKCMSCYNQLVSIRAFILKRQTLQGKLGQTFRELHILLQALD